MATVCRISDIGSGVCYCHPPLPSIPMVGTIITGIPTVTSEGLSQAVMGGIVMGSCGHIGVLLVGSGVCTAGGIGLSRTGDSFSGCFTGVLISGSSKVTSP